MQPAVLACRAQIDSCLHTYRLRFLGRCGIIEFCNDLHSVCAEVEARSGDLVNCRKEEIALCSSLQSATWGSDRTSFHCLLEGVRCL